MSSLEPLLEQEQRTSQVAAGFGPETAGRSQREIAWRRFKQHKMALVGLFVLAVLYLSAIFAPAIAPYDPSLDLDLDHVRATPSWDHLMGTDEIGRDEFSRVLFGGRVSLSVGFAAALSAGLIGTAIGAIAGYRGGWMDNVLMRVTDIFLALPFLAVALVVASALPGRIIDIVAIISAFFWMPVARIVRGLFLSIKEKEYVEAARASGARAFRIILRHMLPNALGPIIVNITLGIALAIIVESTLSFLGFGIRPPTATWGNMLNGSRESMLAHPWLVWFPGLMIFITVLAVNFVGDGLRDALDPTGQRVRA
jgi:peptide/nickel transport system permease protein